MSEQVREMHMNTSQNKLEHDCVWLLSIKNGSYVTGKKHKLRKSTGDEFGKDACTNRIKVL